MALGPTYELPDPLEPSLPDTGMPLVPKMASTTYDAETGEPIGGVTEDQLRADNEIVAFLQDASRVCSAYRQPFIANWEQAEDAWRSKHWSGSKYNKPHYNNRSKYFKPKTRSAVKKAVTATKAALFSTRDVVQFSATDDENKLQQANAAILKELLNMRFTDQSIQAGVPWKQIVLGGRMQTQKTGFCAAKVDWCYYYQDTPDVQKTPAVDPMTGQPMMGADGQPMMDSREIVRRRIMEDKPRVQLFPPEAVRIHPQANWIDPAQSSPALFIDMPMTVDSVRTMMAAEGKTKIKWRHVTDAQLMAALYSDKELVGLKNSRDNESGTNKAGQTSTSGTKGLATGVVDVKEVFWKKDGQDWQAWMLGEKVLLSDPTPTAEVYPERGGMRPIIIGTDTLEPDVLYPESAVHSWQPAQAEINDLANVNMDTLRQAAYPVTKIRRGKNIDYRALQNRGPNTIIQTEDPTSDVVFDRINGNNPGITQQMSLLSNDMDDLSGGFNQGSVQANRQLNETVGGMSLIAAEGGATADFDLGMYVETFVRPLLMHIVMVEQHFEDDMTLLAVAGQKAKVFIKYGISEFTDELLESQVNVNIDLGSGSSNPLLKLQQFKGTLDIATPYMVMAAKEAGAKIQYESILDKIFSLGVSDSGAAPFIEIPDASQGPPPVPVDKVKELMGATQKQMMGMAQEIKDLKAGHDIDMAKVVVDKYNAETNRMKIGAAATTDTARVAIEQANAMTDALGLHQQMTAPDAAPSPEGQGGMPAAPDSAAPAPQDQTVAMLSAIRMMMQQTQELVGAITQRADATDQAMRSLAMTMAAQVTAQRDSTAAMIAALTAPKQIQFDETGMPVGMVTEMAN